MPCNPWLIWFARICLHVVAQERDEFIERHLGVCVCDSDSPLAYCEFPSCLIFFQVTGFWGVGSHILCKS